MDKVKFKKIRSVEHEVFNVNDEFMVVVDFDNDRHHSVLFENGSSRDEIVHRLRMLAESIESDKALDSEGI